jgi:hypothetical protein
MIKNTNTNTSLKNKNHLSSGNLFLDKIIGGISLGTIVLLNEDDPSNMYEHLIKYFIAEGIINENKIFLYYSDEKTATDIIQNLPYKSVQVDSILNAKRVMDSKTSDIKIAWRYENIQYSNLLEDIAKSSEYIFDLSRQLQDIYLIDKNKDIIKQTQITPSFPDNLNEINTNIIKDYQNFTSTLGEDEIKFCRIVIPNLFSNDYNVSKKNIDKKILNELKIKLTIIKNLARSINGIVYLTVNKNFLNKDVYNLLNYFSDYVFSLKSFTLDPEKLQDYDGLLYINKLPRLTTLKTTLMETDTYGVIMEKRKMIIEKIDIGVEVDRNTKVKEKDITASQAICGQEKYSKNYEF